MLNVQLLLGGILPKKAHEGDAGWDLFTPVGVILSPRQVYKIDLRIKIAGEIGKYYRIDDKSGIAVMGVHVIGGIIDRNYTGSIHVVVHNLSNEIISFYNGAKIAQLLVCPVDDDSIINIVNDIAVTPRGDGGFGSTGV